LSLARWADRDAATGIQPSPDLVLTQFAETHFADGEMAPVETSAIGSVGAGSYYVFLVENPLVRSPKITVQ
jgi:hypothetical protein